MTTADLYLFVPIYLAVVFQCWIVNRIYGLLTRIASALSDEGFKTPAAIEAGTWPWAKKFWDKLRLRRYYPSGRIPKF